MAKKESVNAARAMVLRKRWACMNKVQDAFLTNGDRNASGDKSSIDLHGTTVAEATVIVEEILAEQPTSQARPLKIITGRGSHSVNQTSVLKPALKKRLVEDGWVVGMWEAGLVVRGRR
jgi:DNA-nicking Smr family endonuclease